MTIPHDHLTPLTCEVCIIKDALQIRAEAYKTQAVLLDEGPRKTMAADQCEMLNLMAICMGVAHTHDPLPDDDSLVGDWFAVVREEHMRAHNPPSMGKLPGFLQGIGDQYS